MAKLGFGDPVNAKHKAERSGGRGPGFPACETCHWIQVWSAVITWSKGEKHILEESGGRKSPIWIADFLLETPRISEENRCFPAKISPLMLLWRWIATDGQRNLCLMYGILQNHKEATQEMDANGIIPPTCKREMMIPRILKQCGFLWKTQYFQTPSICPEKNTVLHQQALKPWCLMVARGHSSSIRFDKIVHYWYGMWSKP